MSINDIFVCKPAHTRKTVLHVFSSLISHPPVAQRIMSTTRLYGYYRGKTILIVGRIFTGISQTIMLSPIPCKIKNASSLTNATI